VFIIPEAKRSGTPPCAAFDRRSPSFLASALTTHAHHEPDRSSPDPVHDLKESLPYCWIAPDLSSTLIKYPRQYLRSLGWWLGGQASRLGGRRDRRTHR